MYKYFNLLSIAFLIACNGNKETEAVNVKETKEVYTANWESLSKHAETPEWFKDAKFGIYFHWGVYSVPAFGSEWYPSKMYIKGTKEYEHHRAFYGTQEAYGYHKFVPQFKAEKFNAEEWVALFKKAGAKFAGPVAQHHDGFAMWKSNVNPWNSYNKGPKIDITGELTKAIRKNDMKLITTFHHARNLQRNANNLDRWGAFNSHFTYHPNYDTSSKDPELSLLYGNISAEKFHQNWSAQINEVVKQYHPDMIWFDSWLNFIPEKRVQQMCADYFNHGVENNQEVVIGYKQSDLPKEVGVLDIEQGGRKDITERVWMTDITLSNQSWSYVKGQTYKDATLVMRNLIDVVSKNGVVLLNVSPKADGSIPVEQQKVLTEMGDWFSKYGESIYNTKPWDLYGFGNATASEGHFGGQSATVAYTANDIRFTQSKDEKSMYMFFLGKPKVGKEYTFRLLAKHRYCPHSKIKRLVVLGTDQEVTYDFSDTDMKITIPDIPMDSIATVFKFELE
ncbi:alpha-L-fucosidase [Wenyingzhuangia heitensis]|uniref:alpha-L-fucosidase n=1 Tax=Wenyingzhuangia heitensis TaxID=1487859 RepID=A0ABX0U8U2_9FLAO|nr:alpha-L-fucosidase [Wenyingzhuangia heitensis]NIJ45253.1 alpha-L-fucosidase [Wenyingzhuangia heitensis]